MWIATVVDHRRIVGGISKRETAIVARGNTFATGRAVEGRNDHVVGSGLESAGVRPINGCAARPNVIPVGMGINCIWQLLPMHHVCADRVTPISLSPIYGVGKAHAVRIVLIVEVILAL